MFQVRKHDKIPLINLPDKEFKVMAIKDAH